MTVAFQGNAWQSSAFQAAVTAPATAFQPNAFQESGFQILEQFAFQRCAFQHGAFQVEECPQPSTGGGGAGRGWSRERELLELSLEMRQAAQVMRQSKRPQAKALARKLADYTAERVDLAALEREYRELLRRVSKADMDADLRSAALVMEAFIRDENDALVALALSLDMDARLLGAIHGDTGRTQARSH